MTIAHFLSLAILITATSTYAATSCIQNKNSGEYETSNDKPCPAALAHFSGEQHTQPTAVITAVAVLDVKPTHVDNVLPESVWNLRAEDGSVYAALKRWASVAGWQMSWEIPVDFPIEILDSSTGTFEDSVRRVLTALRVADYPPYPCFHENKVVRVVRRIQGNDDECKQ